tara:strand:+ start:1417 stop:1698 length:282 start_codon:yes stop_codon:yes gene_type:complete
MERKGVWRKEVANLPLYLFAALMIGGYAQTGLQYLVLFAVSVIVIHYLAAFVLSLNTPEELQNATVKVLVTWVTIQIGLIMTMYFIVYMSKET